MTPLGDGGDNTGVIVLVAARNEAERIGATLAALREAFPAARLWVADDGSRDGTAQLATAAGAEVIGGAWVGKGGAITRVARRALASTGSEGGDGRVEGSVAGGSGVAAVEEIARSEARAPIVLLCDGDLGASAARLSALVEAVRDDEADLAVARFARPVGGGFGLTLGFARWAVRRRCAQATRAPLSGQRALRADALARLLPLAAGYGMEVGMTIDAARAGLRVREIELDLAHRSRGRTPRGFAHRARQLFDVARAYAVRR